jgi:hypothetical protein
VFVVSKATKAYGCAVDKPLDFAITLATIIQNSLLKSLKPFVIIKLWMPSQNRTKLLI